MSVRVDSETKARMAELADVNWAHVIRDAVRERLEIEEELRKPLNRRRAARGAKAIDSVRKELGSARFDSTAEVRKWRDSRR